MENEHQRREGVIVSDDLLAFADTRHLTKVIESNWATFAPVFKNRVRTGVSFEALTSYRNAVQHGRRLVPFERDLLSGISGQIRNMITLHLNRVQEARRHYPLIESATDSLGNIALEGDVYPWDEDNPLAEFEVGDVLTLDASAWDPKDRKLNWLLLVSNDYMTGTWNKYVVSTTSGNPVSVRLSLTEEMVALNLKVGLALANASPYHAHPGSLGLAPYDDIRYFHYRANPPE